MKKKLLKKIIKHCRKLGKGKIQPRDSTEGLCHELWEVFYSEDYQYIDALTHLKIDTTKWKHYSGDIEYPIPHKRFKPERAYQEYDNLWCSGKYGNKRRKFCLWVAKQLENQNEK